MTITETEQPTTTTHQRPLPTSLTRPAQTMSRLAARIDPNQPANQPDPQPGQQPGQQPGGQHETTDWREDAACRNDPQPDRWVDLPPIRVRGKNNPAYDQHRADLATVCATCPVRVECLTEALGSSVRGIFAGTDEYDRADIREDMGMPDPAPLTVAENDEDARLIEQQFTAHRLARQGLTNQQIAAELDVSAMTVSRLFASEDRPARRRSRHRTPEVPDQRTG